jgi:hypothetical protein
MLENYSINDDGVIYQINPNPISYTFEYSVAYDRYGEMSNYMSHLRLGYIVGSINHIPESILDVGYGNGSFLKTCSKIIPKCYGNDISGYKIPQNCIFVDDIKSQFFEVITFFDSLEHFSDIEFVRELNCKYVCISVPWCHYHNDEWFKNWKHRRINEHLFHFNEKSLSVFMKRMGFSNISYAPIEDVIRQGKEDEKNILTAIFQKD